METRNNNDNQICFAGPSSSAPLVNVGSVPCFITSYILPGHLIYFHCFSYHFSAPETQTAILTSGLCLELQPFIFYSPVGISTRCPEQ